MRSHVGKHILFGFRNLVQFSVLKPGAAIGLDPCGWCGRDGCLTQLSKKGNTYSITSSCEYHYGKMVYGRAATSSQSSPCTNVPIHCPVCPLSASGQPRTIWKYNAMNHFISEHVPEGGVLPQIPPEFLIDSFITSKEEKLMGISIHGTSAWRTQHGIPPSDDVEVMRQNVKRDRAESNVTQPPTKKKSHNQS